MKLPPQHLQFQIEGVQQTTQRTHNILHALGKSSLAILATFTLGTSMIAGYSAMLSNSALAVEPREVLVPIELPVPGEPRVVDVKISYQIPDEVLSGVSELVEECRDSNIPTVTPTLSAFSESLSEADDVLVSVSQDVSTVIVKDVAITDAKHLQDGTLSRQGLALRYPDAEIEVVPLEKIVTEQQDLQDSENEKVQISIVEEPTLSEEELVTSIASASESIKIARENLSKTDLVLLGASDDLTGLSDEELDVLNDFNPSDAVTTEYLRRISEHGSGLMGYSNGLVDESVLSPLSWNPQFLMQKDAARMFELLNRDFKAESGYDLRLTSTYRPLSVQYEVRARDPYMTAVPGTSNHGYGLAVDIAAADDPFISFDSYEYQWMLENGHKYGWMHPYWARNGGSMIEPWHFEFGTFYGDKYPSEFNNPQDPPFRAVWLSSDTGLIG